MTRRLACIGILAIAFGLAACGRQGPLQLPPEAPPTAPTAESGEAQP
jgi:predicted small lipoprotein YifL